jgi:hypothetical protein
VAERTIDTRYFQFKVTIPPFTTTPSTPQVNPVDIQHGIFLGMELQVPSGHVGLTGFSMRLAGTPIVPWAVGLDYIVAEDDRIPLDVNIEVDVGGLVTACYNLDIYEHSFYYRIALRYINNPAAAGAPVPLLLPPALGGLILPPSANPT